MFPVPNPTATYWLRGPEYEKHHQYRSTETLPKTARVVVIGAGMTGLSTAFHLSEHAQEDIVVLDARGISEGATGRNAGHLWASTGYITPPSKEDIDKFGQAGILKMQQFETENFHLLMGFVKKFGVECEEQLTGALRVATTEKEHQELKEYLDILNKLELNFDGNVSYWDAEKCKSGSNCPQAKGGLYYKRAGQLWPAKVVWKLADVCHGRGVNIQTQTKVTKVDKQSNGKLLVQTDRGVILADNVVYATNAYTAALLPEFKNIIVPTRGQMMVTSPVKTEFQMPLWFNYGYEYVNQRLDKRLVAGGMRWVADGQESGVHDDSQVNRKVADALKDFVWSSFPFLAKEGAKVDYEWTGIMAFTPDENPLVGKIRGENEWISAGFTGYGMPRTFHGGKYLAEMMLGKLPSNKVIKQYDPARFNQQKAKL